MKRRRIGWTISNTTRQAITFFQPQEICLIIKVNPNAGRDVNSIHLYDLVKCKYYRISRNPKCRWFVSDIHSSDGNKWEEDKISVRRMQLSEIIDTGIQMGSLIGAAKWKFPSNISKAWQQGLNLIVLAKTKFDSCYKEEEIVRNMTTKALLEMWFSNKERLTPIGEEEVNRELNERDFGSRQRMNWRNSKDVFRRFTPG